MVAEVTLTVAAPGLMKNDPYSYLANRFVVRVSTNGYPALSKNGSFSYKPKPGYVGTDKFTYRDVRGLVFSSAVTVTINVKAA